MLKAKIMEIQGESAKLRLDDGQILHLPLLAIEGECKIGSDAALIVALPGSEDAGRSRLARDLLNELLKG